MDESRSERPPPGVGYDSPPPAARPLLEQLNSIVRLLFLAGLAMHSLQQSADSEFGRGRAELAVAALDEALSDLRTLGAALLDAPT